MNLTITASIYFYFVFVGACYLLGFWTPLHFNILQFVSPIDILKSATYPILPAAIGIFFSVLIDSYNSSSNPVRKPEENDPKVIMALLWMLIILFLVMLLFNAYFFIVQLYKLFMSEPEQRLLYALPIASLISIVYLIHKPPFMKSTNKLIRNFVIIFISILPTAAYIQGDKNIKEILQGKASFYKLKGESKVCKPNEKSDMIYLGLYGNKYLFIDSKSKDICVESESSIMLTYYEFKINSPKQTTKIDENKVPEKTITTASTLPSPE